MGKAKLSSNSWLWRPPWPAEGELQEHPSGSCATLQTRAVQLVSSPVLGSTASRLWGARFGSKPVEDLSLVREPHFQKWSSKRWRRIAREVYTHGHLGQLLLPTPESTRLD